MALSTFADGAYPNVSITPGATARVGIVNGGPYAVTATVTSGTNSLEIHIPARGHGIYRVFGATSHVHSFAFHGTGASLGGHNDNTDAVAGEVIDGTDYIWINAIS